MGAALERAASADPGPVIGDGFGGVGDGVGGIREVAVAIPGDDEPWGVLTLLADVDGDQTAIDPDLLIELAAAIGVIVEAALRTDEAAHRLHRADALRRVAGDIGSRLDLDRILAGLVDHAMVLFNGDRAAVFLRARDGRATAEVSRGLSARYLESVIDFPIRSLPSVAVAARRPLYATHYRDDPRAGDVRAAVVQEGFDTICTAPLFDSRGVDRPAQRLPRRSARLDDRRARHDGRPRRAGRRRDQERPELRADGDLGRPAPVDPAARRAPGATRRRAGDRHRDRDRAAPADRLPQRPGVPASWPRPDPGRDAGPGRRVRRRDAGAAPRSASARASPAGSRSSGSPRTSPTPRPTARANTIPGTDDDLDESMLLAPMIYEDQVLGVLVLSKLGLHQFAEDDLRLLVIYASFAAQAFANADATSLLRAQSEALGRQLANQRALLGVTESILATLDTAGGPRPGRRAAVRARRLRQPLDRGPRPAHGPPPPADREGHPCRRVPRAVAARRGGSRDVGRRPQRAGPRPRRGRRRAGQPVPVDGPDGRQHDLRPAPRPRRRHRRPDARADRARPALQRGGVRARPAVRGAGLDRAPERGGPPGGRDPGPDGRPDRPPQPRRRSSTGSPATRSPSSRSA